ncbi:MAG: L,D-transpeptidase [Deltaproteobacteria bacterium]|nr:L,D-transpeptidase [Deltaproteobacteria bacterium]
MNRSGPLLAAIAVAAAPWWGCSGRRPQNKQPGAGKSAQSGDGTGAAGGKRVPRPRLSPLRDGEVYLYDEKTPTARTVPATEARAQQRLVVDLSDAWAPYIFQDGNGDGNGDGGAAKADSVKADSAKPNAYRKTFVDLANDRIAADGGPLPASRDEHNFLEPFGIPPTLGVLRARVEQDLSVERRSCLAKIDLDGLRAFTGNVAYIDREHARREHAEALRDADWLANETALKTDASAKVRARADRAVQGQERLRAVRAAQARLVCEGLLSARSRFTSGMFDLPTHEALAAWERKNDIFGWASLGGETLAALTRSAMDLNFETLRRILAERVADAAGIVEDGSTSKGKAPPTYVVGGGDAVHADAGSRKPVPNLIDDHVIALLASVHVASAADMVDFLRQHDAAGLTTLRVAVVPPALPAYYGPRMDLSVEIDRGDVWYDFPFDGRGRPVEQHRDHFPQLTLFVHWSGQKIPLCRWRTTIGSWRSELHANGKVYYKYKNSDVGPRLWKNIVAGPVWIPPDATPAKDLLTRKVLDRNKGPEVVVNSEVMGPGFQSAYGLVMAIHIDRSGFDNQIRTHGSVDYTSIARRFSHGCHRLVNNRAVRMFDFVLRRQPFRRIGSVPLALKRTLVVDAQTYAFEVKTRGYYYELARPIPVTVSEGRIMGPAKAPIVAYVRKAGVDYSGIAERTDVGNVDNVGNVGDVTDVGGPDTDTNLPIPADPAPTVEP